jgi:hypothetical protein
MTKFIAILWFTNCGWNCKNPPTLPVFDTLEDCERAVFLWVNERKRGRGGVTNLTKPPPTWEGKRHGECRPV